MTIGRKGLGFSAAAFLAAAALSLTAGEKVVVSGHPDYPPVMWRDNGALTGAAAELAQIVLGEMGYDCDFVSQAGDWAAVQKSAREGKTDVIAAAYKDDDRLAYLDYSPAFMKDPVSVAVKKGGEFKFSGWEDLTGKTGVTGPGESYGAAMDRHMKEKLNVKRAPVAEGLKLLLSGGADYMIIGRYPGYFRVRAEGLANEITFLPEPVTTQDFYLTVSKKSKLSKRMPEISKRIEELRADGTADRLVEKYMARMRGAPEAKDKAVK
jgi:polar amino acid transport system substrate-binding protein